jgi:signal transduction histidine kinase
VSRNEIQERASKHSLLLLFTKRVSLGEEYDVPEIAMENSRKLPEDVTSRLRALAHDLSNSLETILQAAYLLGQAKLDDNNKKWTQLIDTAANDAARINRQIRDILRSQG